MTQWLPFFAVVAGLTLVLLVLARRSQGLIDETVSESDQETATEQGVAETIGTSPAQQADAGSGESLYTEAERSATETPVDASEVPATERTTDDRGPHPPANPAEELPQQPPGQNVELTSGAMLANVAVTQGLVAVSILGAAWYFEIPARAFGITADPSSIGLPAVALGIAFGVVLWVGNEISTTLADAVGAAYDESVRELIAPDSSGGWLLLFAVILPIIAIAEELLFRAALIGVPAAGFGLSPWLLAVVSSFAFALGHGAQGRVGVVVTGLLGFVLAAGYILSGSLLLVVVAHYIINGLEFFVHEYLDVENVISQSRFRI